MPRALVLTTITGSQVGRRHTFEARTATIGSSPQSDLVLNERTIDPRHAELQQILERWFIVPLNAQGRGMLLNGSPITGRSRLNPGDQLTIGGMSYRVSFVELVEEAVGATPPRGSQSVPRLGEYFVRRGALSFEQVNRVIQRQNELQREGLRTPFGQIAYQMGFIDRRELEAALADQRADFNQNFID